MRRQESGVFSTRAPGRRKIAWLGAILALGLILVLVPAMAEAVGEKIVARVAGDVWWRCGDISPLWFRILVSKELYNGCWVKTGPNGEAKVLLRRIT